MEAFPGFLKVPWPKFGSTIWAHVQVLFGELEVYFNELK